MSSSATGVGMPICFLGAILLILTQKSSQKFGDVLGIMMLVMLLIIWYPKRKSSTPFHWHWGIILISVFLSAADFVYFYALSFPDAMISIVSMVRRGSVIVSFLFGAMMLHEKNLKSKMVDLLLVLLGMVFLYIGSK